jgi:hypothetical protein
MATGFLSSTFLIFLGWCSVCDMEISSAGSERETQIFVYWGILGTLDIGLKMGMGILETSKKRKKRRKNEQKAEKKKKKKKN